MENDKNPQAKEACCIPKKKAVKCNDVTSAVYCMGFIGSAVYFIQHATSFWNGVLGVLKAIVWPTILVYKLLELLKM